MNDFQVIPVTGKLLFTVDFTDQVPTGVTVTQVIWSAVPALTLNGQSNDLANKKSSIRAELPSHGVTYQVKAVATLENGEEVPKFWTGIGFNG